ncbi:Dse1p Ecym_8393 [Eremothecium cymbalariae DBVPG|uniref:Uncharacterized protein n=1 Tax=Eremothecium cymbalariae (strain CBS 270.75 / DBVPG 7215 / KCTC 17166 / NRRL Y-17582) TaxID=931890 RepID=G8JXT9_ERECY|nr:Hypothetical protein Ecym_8393 [Eremothecium cymbalariae DBVPG\
MQQEESYYWPPRIHRQPAIVVRPRGRDLEQLKSHQIKEGYRRSYHSTDVTKMGSTLLRKASGDVNDYYTTKKVKSHYWQLKTEEASLLSFSVCPEYDIIVVSNSSKEGGENLKLYRYNNVKQKLHQIQAIMVPGESIIVCSIPRFTYSAFRSAGYGRREPADHDFMILIGHQDWIVNLIGTSLEHGNAKIIKRFNHGKYLRQLCAENKVDDVIKKRYHDGAPQLPIRQLITWRDKDTDLMGFVSLISQTLFIYTFDSTRPFYVRAIPGIESFDLNPDNVLLLAMSGPTYGYSGISLLDLTAGEEACNLYAPSPDSAGHMKDSATSGHCIWLDANTLVNSVGNVMKIWDICTPKGLMCTITGHRGHITSIAYHKETCTLYSSDDHGYLLCWDLSTLNNNIHGRIPREIKKLTLCQGFQSISIAEEDYSTVIQCGNIIVSPDIQRLSSAGWEHMCHTPSSGVSELQCMGDGTLITLDSAELGMHRLQNTKCYPQRDRMHRFETDRLNNIPKSTKSKGYQIEELDPIINSDFTLVESGLAENNNSFDFEDNTFK